jgi:hypothetical protein
MFNVQIQFIYHFASVFGILNQAFATPLWFKEEAGLQYKFTYKHLTAASVVE